VNKNQTTILAVCVTALSLGGMWFYNARNPVTQVVVNPAAPTSNIAATIEDDRSRGIVSAYCLAWSQSMNSATDLGHYYSARKVADNTLQAASKLPPGLKNFDAALSKRIEAAVGLDPSRTDLVPAADVFRKVSSELQ